jgi:D-psicose/D-tagatose/L-ribulose 3-epimerase
MARPIGIHLSYWQNKWSDDLLPLIKLARQAGFDGAEIPLLDPAAIKFSDLRQTLDTQGLKATCGTGLNPTTDITSPDSAIRQAGIAHLRACLEGAAVLGSPVLGGVTYAPWGQFPQDDRLARRRQCIASLREVANIAADVGVVVGLEILNRYEGYLLNTVEQGLALVAEVNRPAIKLHLDTYHLHVEEDSTAVAIRTAGDQLGHFHCSENNRKRPGAGQIAWTAVKQALDDIDYQGWLVMESFVQPGDEVGRDLFIWRRLYDDLQSDAQAGAAFMRREVAGV